MASGYYDITNKTLGKGHFGVVKLGRHCLTGEPVAIKIIEKSRLNNDSLNQLGTEIRILFRLSEYEHPNILKLYQTIDSEDKLFLVTEYCGLHACDLHDYLSRKHRREGLSKRDAQGFFIQIYSAISYCHSMGIVHRDLKPENVLVTDYMHSLTTDKSGSHQLQHPLLKLIDFGFANQWYPDEKMRTSCGTLAYSAPELLLGKPYDGTKVDVWGLGLMLYILLYGGNPFMQINDNETLTKILDCSFLTPIRENVDIDAVELLKSLINRNPDSRLSIDAMLRHKWFSNLSMPFEVTLKHKSKTDQPSPHPLKQLNKLAPVVSPPLPSISESGPLKDMVRSVDDNQVKAMPYNDSLSETSYPHHNRTRSLSITRIHPKPIQQNSLPQTKSSINLERLNPTTISVNPQALKSPQQHRGVSPIYRPTSPDVSGCCAPLSDEEVRLHEQVIQEMLRITELIDTKSSIEASLKNASFAHRLFNQNSIQPTQQGPLQPAGLIKTLIQSRLEQTRNDSGDSHETFPKTEVDLEHNDKFSVISQKLCNDDYIYATYQLTRDRILRLEHEQMVGTIRQEKSLDVKADEAASHKVVASDGNRDISKANTLDFEDPVSTKENESFPSVQRKHLQPQHKMRDKFTSFFHTGLTSTDESTSPSGELPQQSASLGDVGANSDQPASSLTTEPSSIMPQIHHEAFSDHNNETSGSTSRHFTSRTDLLQNSTAYALPLARKCSLVSEESGGSNDLSDS